MNQTECAESLSGPALAQEQHAGLQFRDALGCGSCVTKVAHALILKTDPT